MHMYQRAYDQFNTSSLSDSALLDFEQQRAEFLRERELLEATDAYQTQYNLGASVSYKKAVNKGVDFTATFTVQNLFNNRYRYYVSTGSSGTNPSRLSFMEEPEVYGLVFGLSY